MNERVDVLAVQSGFPARRSFSDLSDLYPRLEKYTELIIRECICQCDDENSQKYIMQHFGMDENNFR